MPCVLVTVPWCTICAYLNSPKLRIAVVNRRVFYTDGTKFDFLCCQTHRGYPLDGIVAKTTPADS